MDLTGLEGLPPAVAAEVAAFLERSQVPISDPGQPTRHHYVPQFYLKRFATEDERIAVIRLEDPTSHQVSHVRNVAVFQHLYTVIDKNVGETAAVEHLLALIDGLAAPAVARLAYGVFFPPNDQDRLNLSWWIAMQYARSPGRRREMEAMADLATKLELSLIRDAAGARKFLVDNGTLDPSDEEIAALLADIEDLDRYEFVPHQNELVQLMLNSAAEIAPYLLDRFWSVAQFPEPGLILSDAPVTLYQRPENWVHGVGVGLGNADEVWFPLDRSTALIMHRDETIGGRIFDSTTECMNTMNQNTAAHSWAEIYAHPDDLPRLNSLELPDADHVISRVSGADWLRGSVDGISSPIERKRHRRYSSH